MKLALVTHPDRAEAAEVAAAARAGAERRGIGVGGREDVAGADVVIAIGGDGTVLQAAHLALQHDLPVLGINVGHIGYLTAADPPDLDFVLDALEEGSCTESTRMTVHARWDDGEAVGLNDAVIEKVVTQHAVRVTLAVDGRHFTTYRADGVVVATPTGSTAYAFSAGGPMVDPELEALVVTPVAAHNLFAPTVLFSGDTRLGLRMAGERPGRLNLDGREAAVLRPGQEIEVSGGPMRARFLHPRPRPFDQVVREKFRLDED